jgi:hypothetical protein
MRNAFKGFERSEKKESLNGGGCIDGYLHAFVRGCASPYGDFLGVYTHTHAVGSCRRHRVGSYTFYRS